MARGRPTKPTEIKQISGTLRKSRVVNEPAAEELATIPDAPKDLSPKGKAEWGVVCQWLFDRNMLAGTDLSILAMYCNEIAKYWELEETLQTEGRVMVKRDDNGNITYSQQLPEVAMQQQSLKAATMLATQFGFTPSARGRLAMPEKKKEGKLSKLMK